VIETDINRIEVSPGRNVLPSLIVRRWGASQPLRIISWSLHEDNCKRDPRPWSALPRMSLSFGCAGLPRAALAWLVARRVWSCAGS